MTKKLVVETRKSEVHFPSDHAPRFINGEALAIVDAENNQVALFPAVNWSSARYVEVEG